MKKILLTFIFLTSLTFGQRVLFDSGEPGWGVSLDGSTESAAVTPYYITTDLGSELCANTGFETNTSGWAGYGTGTITRITADFHSGVASAECVTNGLINGVYFSNSPATPYCSVVNGKLVLQFWAKTVSGDAVLSVTSGGYSLVRVNGVLATTISLTSTWTLYSCEVLNAGYGVVGFFTLAAGTWRIDDVSSKQTKNSIDISGFERIKHNNNSSLEASIGQWVTGGTHVPTRSTTDKKTGSASMLITSSGVGDATTNYVSLPATNFETIVAGHSYKIQYEARVTTGGTTVTSGMGTKFSTLTGISSTLGTFTKGIYNFTATASEVNVPLKFYLSAADLVYIDNISITEVYPLEIEAWFKTSTTGTLKVIASRQTSTTTASGYGFQFDVSTGNKLHFQLYDASGSTLEATGSTTITDGVWKKVKVTFDPVTGVINLYVNNVLDGTATVNAGRTNNTQNLSIGKYSYTGSGYFDGSLGNVKVTIGGEIRAFYKWKGSTDADFLNDWSTFLNDLTGTNVTQSDQIRGVSPYVLE